MARTHGNSWARIATTLLAALTAAPLAAQDAASDIVTPDAKVRTVIDESPLPSARAAAMGGAISTVADDLVAAFHNPAGIGGLNWDKEKPPFVRKLFFPHVSAAANQNTKNLQGTFKSSGADSNAGLGKSLADAHANQRQYARVGLNTGFVLGRTMVVPFQDIQLAAASRGEGTEQIDMHYRSMSGIGAGFSATDAAGRLSIGYFGYTASRSDVSGTFLYDDIDNTDRRSDLLSDHAVKSTGTGHNAGLIWRLGKAAAPTLALSLKNAGDTTFTASGDGDDITVKQDATVGFSINPRIFKTGGFLFLIEAGQLEDPDVSFVKKFRTGLELTLGGFGSYATFALRAGYNAAGASGGLALNLGLIGCEASLQSVDIGVGNESVIEQRIVGQVYVNVAEF